MTRPISWNDSGVVCGPVRTKTKLEINPLTFCEEALSRNEWTEFVKKKPKKSIPEEDLPDLMWFCDFETYIEHCVSPTEKQRDDAGNLVARDWHKTYCCSCWNWGEDKHNTFYGEFCFDSMLKWIYQQMGSKLTKKHTKTGPVLHFHNLKYDSCFVLQRVAMIYHNTEKGNRMLKFKAALIENRKPLKFTCKDTIGVLNCALASTISNYWPEAEREALYAEFGKELFPYKILKSLDTKYVTMEKCCEELTKQGDDPAGFKEKCIKAGCYREGKKREVNIKKYCGYYCERDCYLLCKAWKQARKLYLGEEPGMNSPIKLDINNHLTTAGIANAHFMENCFTKGGIFGFQSALRMFEQLGVRGGRCMTRDNESWWIKNLLLLDFDAVSLYPSAMKRLYCQLGTPTRLPAEFRGDCAALLRATALEDEETRTSTNPAIKFDAFTVVARVRKVGKKLHFPLLAYKTKEGCCWTNEPMKVAKEEDLDDILVLNEINLADLVQFHEAEIEVLDGYVWNHGKDFTCRKTIEDLFTFRATQKKAGNPIEATAKLIMNSSYGKTVMKLVKTDKKYINEKDLLGHLQRHCYRIKEFFPITNKLWMVEHEKEYYDSKGQLQADEAYPNWWGVRILAMSKRIMAEVMCLAEDIDANIFYTDTDSMQIEAEGLKRLETAFEEKYQRKLVGGAMGQFHSDFKSDWLDKQKKIKGAGFNGEVVGAHEGIYVSKKVYGCGLLVRAEENGEHSYHVDYHKKLKGIPKFAIDSFNKDQPLAVYEQLFNSVHKKIPKELDPENTEAEDRKVLINPVVFPLCQPNKGRFVFTGDKQIYTDITLKREVGNKNLIRNKWTANEDGSIEKQRTVIEYHPNVPTSTIPPPPTPEVEVEVEDEAEQPKEPWSCEEHSDHIDLVL